MVLGFNNFNMFGMTGNCYGGGGMFNLLGGGMPFGGMLGGGCGLGMMSGSIWGGCYNNYNSMAGFAVGNILMNVAGCAVSQVVADKRANSKEALSGNLDNIQSQIDTKLKNLDASESTYKTKLADDTKVNEAQANIDKVNNTKLPKLKGELTTLEGELKTLETSLAGETDETKKTKIESDIKTKKQEIEAKNTEIKDAEDSVKASGTLGVALANAKKAQKLEQDKIDAQINEISKLIQEREELKADIDDKILDKADGGHWQQTKKSKFENKYTGFGTENEQLIDKRITREDIRYIIQNYRDASSEEQKELWKKRFEQAYNELETKDRTTSFNEAKKIILG